MWSIVRIQFFTEKEVLQVAAMNYFVRLPGGSGNTPSQNSSATTAGSGDDDLGGGGGGGVICSLLGW